MDVNATRMIERGNQASPLKVKLALGLGIARGRSAQAWCVLQPAGTGGWSLDVVPGRVVHPGLLGGWELPSTSVQGGHGMKLHGTAALSWSDRRRQGWVEGGR